MAPRWLHRACILGALLSGSVKKTRGWIQPVLRVRAVADEVGDVGIDTPDQRLGVGERVTVEHLASFLHDGMLVQSDPMTKVKTTMYVDEDVLREIRVAAARRGRPVSELIDDALRESTLIGLLERVWARNADLSEADAMELANSELRAMRVERDAAA